MAAMRIKVLDKAVQVVELLARSNRAVRLKEVAQTLRMNKTTAFRILSALEAHSIAMRNGAGTFALGNRVLWWETCYRRNFELLGVVHPYLEKLRDVTSETVAFSVLVGDQTVSVDQVISPHVTSTRFDLGVSATLNAGASGRIMLGYLDPEKQKQFLTCAPLACGTERTIIDRKELEREIHRCRAKGYAMSSGERFPNTTSIAAPIFGRDGNVLGVISVVGPSDRLTQKRCRFVAPLLLEQTRLLTEQISRSGKRQEKTPVASAKSLGSEKGLAE